MRKKLNLVLREPVKLFDGESQVPVLPSPFSGENNKKGEFEVRGTGTEIPAKIGSEPMEVNETVNPQTKQLKEKPNVKKAELKRVQKEKPDLREKMSPRVRQVWEYFCRVAKKDGELKNSFEVTRAEVMRRAQIGSTNTYRDALIKLKTLGLLEIELRPGVNSGSVFYLTNSGREQAELIFEGN